MRSEVIAALAFWLVGAVAFAAPVAKFGVSAGFLVSENLPIDLRKPVKKTQKAPVPGNGGEVVLDDPDALLALDDIAEDVELPQSLLAIEFGSTLKKAWDAKFEVEFFVEGIAAKLREGTMSLALVTGHDLAYLMKHHPNIEVLAYLNTAQNLRSHVVIRAKEEWTGLASLRDLRTGFGHPRFHTILWLEETARSVTGKTNGFLKVPAEQPENAHEALSQLLSWKLDAVVIDEGALEAYRMMNPGLGRRIRVVETSPPSPQSALVYDRSRYDGALNQAMSRAFFGGKPPMNFVGGYMLGLNQPRRPSAEDAKLARSFAPGDGEPFRHRAIRLFNRN